MSFTGCKKETEMEQKLNAIEDSCEFVEISDTDENVSAWVSPEYLQEVEFNSQKNVYFGNWYLSKGIANAIPFNSRFRHLLLWNDL